MLTHLCSSGLQSYTCLCMSYVINQPLITFSLSCRNMRLGIHCPLLTDWACVEICVPIIIADNLFSWSSKKQPMNC